MTGSPQHASDQAPTVALGIDIGGTGMKGALVDTSTGQLRTNRIRFDTPRPSTPAAVAEVVQKIVAATGHNGLVGATFPAVISHGVALTAANVDKAWIGAPVNALLSEATGHPVIVLNDADAAGLAEVRFGAAKGETGVVLMLTFGTGIGSALFVDGHLVPNTELGHLEIDGHDAESRAAASVKDDEKLSFKHWSRRVQRYMAHVEALFAPDLFVVGGGVSKDARKWVPELQLRAPIRVATLLNNAGIVGAALAAVESH